MGVAGTGIQCTSEGDGRQRLDSALTAKEGKDGTLIRMIRFKIRTSWTHHPFKCLSYKGKKIHLRCF